MTTQTHRVAAFVAFYLFASVTIASGECAWVLWWEHETSRVSYRTVNAKAGGAKPESPEPVTQTRSWNILSAYPTSTACERQRTEKIDSMLKRWPKEKAEAATGENIVTNESGGYIISQRSRAVNENTLTFSETLRYLCLPDTVDPRGPKGQ